VTVEVASDTPMALGETLTFSVDPERVHLFDRDSEVAI
jgi:multiple sugar transport system ATP-binding protein